MSFSRCGVEEGKSGKAELEERRFPDTSRVNPVPKVKLELREPRNGGARVSSGLNQRASLGDQISVSGAGGSQKKRKAVVRGESADTKEYESFQLKGMEVDRDEHREELNFVLSAVSSSAGLQKPKVKRDRRCPEEGFKCFEIESAMVEDNGDLYTIHLYTSGWHEEIARHTGSWRRRDGLRAQVQGGLRGQEDLREESFERARACAEFGQRLVGCVGISPVDRHDGAESDVGGAGGRLVGSDELADGAITRRGRRTISARTSCRRSSSSS